MVLAQFIVGTDGAVEPGSFKTLKSSIIGYTESKPATATEKDVAAFEAAVRDAMTSARYVPAKLHGTPVRGLVQQRYIFGVAKK